MAQWLFRSAFGVRSLVRSKDVEKRLSRRLAVFSFVFCLWGCGDSGDAMDPRREADGEKGEFHFVLDGEIPIAQGNNALTLSLTSIATQKPVEGATLTVMAHMPAMVHEMSHGTVTAIGGGLYSISPLSLSMAGRWDVNIDASLGMLEDTVTFTYDLP